MEAHENQVRNPLGELVDRLYAARPTHRLYHYTSIPAALSILNHGALFATDLRYMSDASELSNVAQSIASIAANRVAEHGGDATILHQFIRWLTERLSNGHRLLVTSFTERGNLLSQWRGYTPNGAGISLGFRAEELVEAAVAQQFSIVKCIYDGAERERILKSLVERVEEFAKLQGVDTARHVSESHYSSFQLLEHELLRIAAVLKLEAFSEEAEWRAVSNVMTNAAGLKFRPGVSMVVPYTEFKLPRANDRLRLTRVYVGPAPHLNLSIASITDMLGSLVDGSFTVVNSGIPYRTW